MQIICNGETREIATECSVEQFIIDAGLDPDAVVAECDGRILKRQEYASQMLSNGMRLELIRFVGGG